MTERLTIGEAAERLSVSPDTVRRRLKRGELQGEQEQTPQGFIWRIVLPETSSEPAPEDEESNENIELALLRERVAGLERLAQELQGERNAWREQAQRDGEAAREFRVLLRNEQMRALPVETTRQDAPGAAEAAPHDGQVSSPTPTRLSFWDRIRGKRE